jgi:hypothetical protein
MSNPELMQQVMESPMMQNLMSNPENLQNMLTANPQIQQLMEVWDGAGAPQVTDALSPYRETLS